MSKSMGYRVWVSTVHSEEGVIVGWRLATTRIYASKKEAEAVAADLVEAMVVPVRQLPGPIDAASMQNLRQQGA